MTVTNISPHQSDYVLTMIKKAVPLVLVMSLLGAALSYAAYSDDLSVSAWPWRIGVLIAVLSCAALLFVYVRYRGTNDLCAYGLVMAIGTISTYYFFGIFCYFCYFVFAPMPDVVRWPGLFGGIALNLVWALVVQRNVHRIVNTTPFLDKVIKEHGETLVYDVQRGAAEFDRYHNEPNIMPTVFKYIVFGIAPFYLVMSRLLSSNFGTNGVLLFLAVFGMPVALLFVSLFVRNYALMVVLPRKIAKERGRRVLVAG
ncbi:TPA: hypothetical protein QDC51_001528 [Burkholderia multivorans]|uniref:hypothetical protein n=1 Tax=Burkholderia multivorans TaxID=87883 RepID=UPI0004F718EC|nr:hypothetical protein [Burkholderia multivorans]AIO74688.1 putative membrane protein [Burkholderia multivorans]MBU9352892.1 hypothetical protein [Burkholderia multivorans]MBU9390769.1 hypothetical protein [Burkholderia multivorans]MBU9396534.1 hypothetical protein [Burkholderia multivorans]MBU9551044.1 hypothetical protein [Burkholderia multivorans]